MALTQKYKNNMTTLEESKIIKENGNFPYSISLNFTGCKITPFSTHIKVYENEETYFLYGDYYKCLENALKSFKERCSEKGLTA